MPKRNELQELIITLWTKMILFIFLWVAVIGFLSFRLYTQTKAKPKPPLSTIPTLDPQKIEDLRTSLTDRFRSVTHFAPTTSRAEPFD